MPLWTVLPFAGILLSIAFIPLAFPGFWHRHNEKVAVFWSLVIIIPMLYFYKKAALSEFLNVIIADYIPFIIILFGLFTVSGGILLKGSLRGTPVTNTIMIAIGTILASVMGTTGASMLMIRPILRANDYRKNKTFIVIFFIFLVANIGGSLTPIGDPPLFLGFLHHVPFFWNFNILPHMLTAAIILLLLYFLTDSYHYRKENKPVAGENTKTPISLEGKINFVFILMIIGSMLLCGINLGVVRTFGVSREITSWIRDGIIILAGIFSLKFTPKSVRVMNAFSWSPVREVSYLFAGIFLTMMPCMLLLKAGGNGALSFIINGVKEPYHYFWITGLLSSFLDNAPTYVIFFNSVLGRFYSGIGEANAVALLIKQNAVYLKAISAGAVFFGANTYIGNAPNFMILSIAEDAGVPMPSFFGYIFKYSLIILIPVFIIITLIFF